MGSALRIGVVGVGTISGQYFETISRLRSVELTAVADLDVDRAARIAEEQHVPPMSVADLLAAPDVDVVLNLTIPAAHVEIALRALTAGKHVYTEKPLALDTVSAREVLDARAEGQRVASAPDTVLGTGFQTSRRALDDGLIGEPIGAAVHWSSSGHESWHPAPAFYYQPGGGPLFDMGPYYVTSLVTLFGPVARVYGRASRSSRIRTVAQGALAGTRVPVEVDTHVTAILEHASGATSTVTVSFEEWATKSPLFEVYGTTGTMSVPDPNHFAGPVSVWTKDQPEWRELAESAGYRHGGRGIGLSDLAAAIMAGEPHRASAELGFHVLEIMEAILNSSSGHRALELTSSVDRPASVPFGEAK